jgi:hypothetical protein
MKSEQLFWLECLVASSALENFSCHVLLLHVSHQLLFALEQEPAVITLQELRVESYVVFETCFTVELFWTKLTLRASFILYSMMFQMTLETLCSQELVWTDLALELPFFLVHMILQVGFYCVFTKNPIANLICLFLVSRMMPYQWIFPVEFLVPNFTLEFLWVFWISLLYFSHIDQLSTQSSIALEYRQMTLKLNCWFFFDFDSVGIHLLKLL